MIPSTRDTDFLRIALQPRRERDDDRRLLQAGEIERALDQHQDLLPLVLDKLGDDIPEKSGLASRLELVRRQNDRRTRTFRGILTETLRTFNATGRWFALVDGAALAGTVYDHWQLRPCREIHFLVPGEDLSRSGLMFQEHGFRLDRQIWGPARHDQSLRHEEEISLVLHDRAYSVGCERRDGEASCRRRSVELDDVPTYVLEPEETLMRVMNHLSESPADDRLQWVCDAWSLIDRTPQLDWRRFASLLNGDGDGRVRSGLEYLAAQLGVSIPECGVQTG